MGLPTAVVLVLAGLWSCSIAEPRDEALAASAGDVPAQDAAPDIAPGATSARRLRLLTADQYRNTLSYVFGPGISMPASFAPVTRTDGLLSVGSSFAGVTAGQMEIYQRTATSVAQQVVNEQNRHFLVPCTPKLPGAADEACARKFLGRVGRLIYRGPIEQGRLEAIVRESGDAANRLGDFYAGLGVALEGMLISPRVILVSERAEHAPDRPGRERLDAHSLATRLSLFLWNASPDDRLLQAAEAGELNSRQGLAHQVDRMLDSPRLEVGMRAFFEDMFRFEDLDTLAKDVSIYPLFTGVTAQDSREQTLRTVIDWLLVKNRDYRDLFTTRETFISPALAVVYGLPSAPGWAPHEFPEGSPRTGLLTQVSFLAGHSHPGRSSATLRGKALREILLCQTVPRPPPNVDFSAIENPKANLRTARERVGMHLQNPVCAGCHKITDPIGLAMENFDGAGEYRDSEKGMAIDATGNLDGKPFTDVQGLAQAVHDHPRLPACLVRRVYSYGTGSPADADDPALESLNSHFAAHGYRVRDLLRTVALSNFFAEVATAAGSPAPPSAGGAGN